MEKTFWTLKAKSFVQGAEAGVEGCLGLRNLRGMGERVTVSMEYGSHRLRESGVEYVMPRIGGHSCNVGSTDLMLASSRTCHITFHSV